MLRTGRRSRPLRADVAQLVAHHLAKVRVAGSNPVIRSRVSSGIKPLRWSGRVVRQRPAKPCTRVRFPSPPPKVSTGAISSAGERFPDTEEVTGSIPVSRTRLYAGKTLLSRTWPQVRVQSSSRSACTPAPRNPSHRSRWRWWSVGSPNCCRIDPRADAGCPGPLVMFHRRRRRILPASAHKGLA